MTFGVWKLNYLLAGPYNESIWHWNVSFVSLGPGSEIWDLPQAWVSIFTICKLSLNLASEPRIRPYKDITRPWGPISGIFDFVIRFKQPVTLDNFVVDYVNNGAFQSGNLEVSYYLGVQAVHITIEELQKDWNKLQYSDQKVDSIVVKENSNLTVGILFWHGWNITLRIEGVSMDSRPKSIFGAGKADEQIHAAWRTNLKASEAHTLWFMIFAFRLISSITPSPQIHLGIAFIIYFTIFHHHSSITKMIEEIEYNYPIV